jgi:multicomponent Na+:H+ antiporter subunit D
MLYVLGHGFAKAALFLTGGIMLSACSGIDEIELRGAGKLFPLTGAAYALGGLILAGLPVGLEYQGADLIHATAAPQYRFLPPILGAASGLVGAGILRGAGRIFLGLGPEPGEEQQAPSEEEREKSDRPVWLMLLPIAVLLAASLGLAALPVEGPVRHAAAVFVSTGALAKDTNAVELIQRIAEETT